MRRELLSQLLYIIYTYNLSHMNIYIYYIIYILYYIYIIYYIYIYVFLYTYTQQIYTNGRQIIIIVGSKMVA